MPNSSVFLLDCMNLMGRYKDNHFDIAIVDPPYDFSVSKTSFVSKNLRYAEKFQRFGGEKDKGGFVINHTSLGKCPDQAYFNELFRVSKYQIVFGGNYFTQYLPPSSAWIYWDKNNGNSKFSDGELIWTSFGCGLRSVKKSSSTPTRIHPTQKPVYLYDWIILEYLPKAFSGRKIQMNSILDTHLGSGNSRISAYKNGIDFTGCDIDPFFFKASEDSFLASINQQTIF